MKNKINFEVHHDGIYSSIIQTNEVPKTSIVNHGGKETKVRNDVYKTFAQAQKALIKYHKQRIQEYKMAIEWAKELKEENI